MSCEVVVRRARRGDEAARTALLHRSFSDYYVDTFLYFLVQEEATLSLSAIKGSISISIFDHIITYQQVTLQCMVLGGAVLFIFVGLQASALLAVPPAAAALVAAVVLVMHTGFAERQRQYVCSELAGWVAEAAARGEQAPRDCALRVQPEDASSAAYERTPHKQIVGTVSVSRYWEPQRSGWLQALHVAPGWQRRGIARAMLGAVRDKAVECGFESLETATSELQPAARACLHAAGWDLRGTYQRPVLLWGAVTLPTALLGLDLPHA